ncbi:hypothetical protein [Desulfosporosinus fructosivorans]
MKPLIKIKQCPIFSATKLGVKENCVNCLNWIGQHCGEKDELKENYEDTAKFKAWDRMMRSNRGVKMD